MTLRTYLLRERQLAQRNRRRRHLWKALAIVGPFAVAWLLWFLLHH